MAVFHLIAQLPTNGPSKGVYNCSYDKALEHVTEFVTDQTITTRWGNQTLTRQAYEMRIYETDDKWNRRKQTFADFSKGKRSVFGRLEKEVRKRMPQRRTRVLLVMPIQGDRYGAQSEQNVYREYNERFDVLAGSATRERLQRPRFRDKRSTSGPGGHARSRSWV